MADIDITRAHALGLEGARAAAEKMESALARKFDLKGSWKGNTHSFERSGVSGTLVVGAKEMHLTVTLGFLLKAMKGPIERAVNEELDKILTAKAAATKDEPAKSKKAAAPKKKGG